MWVCEAVWRDRPKIKDGKMMQYKLTDKGLEIMRYLPFIVLGQPIGTGADSFESSAPVLKLNKKEVKNGES